MAGIIIRHGPHQVAKKSTNVSASRQMILSKSVMVISSDQFISTHDIPASVSYTHLDVYKRQIIGYAINDTVVVFDRIREYLGLYPKRNLKENVNNAINSTLSRTINTSGTTLVTLLAIFFFGGETIRGFIFALIIGVVVGTAATIFLATPIAYDLMTKRAKTDVEK